ncbi:MAG: FIST C-terminal domain-containing protein [Thermoleophilia bacterium]|nr:FIST C-terminal domain-containing protein [Thermoleophilia bacterium]
MIDLGEIAATRIAAGLSTGSDAADAGVAAAREAAGGLVDGRVDLAFLFVSPAHLDQLEDAVAGVLDTLRPRHLLGCVAEGVVAGAREVESGAALAVWAAALPAEAHVDLFHAYTVETDEGTAVAGVPAIRDPSLVALLVDPYTFPAGPFLAKLNEEQPDLPVVGGLAAGGGEPEAQALILNDRVITEGAVGAVVSGVRVVTVVSQGCAPIGRDAVITSAEGNVVYELAGQPALVRLQSEIASLTPSERALAARGVLAGLVIDENQAEYGHGDYLMRALLGADEDSGALAVGETVRVGQTLRFHVRDRRTADEDLHESLARVLGDGTRPAGALVFTCNGRGTHMFGEPDHDARAVAHALGSNALAGFFCGGEIGPVGGRAFLHGYTATLAVFLENA